MAETFSAASLRISETGRESFKPVLANCSFLPSMDGVPTFKTGLSFIAICIFPGPPIGIIFSLDIMQSIDGRNCQLQGVFGSPFSSRNRALYTDNGQRKQKKKGIWLISLSRSLKCGYPVTSFHGYFVPSQFVPCYCDTVPVNRLFVPRKNQHSPSRLTEKKTATSVTEY